MADISEAKRTLLAEWERERDELNIVITRLRRELGMVVTGEAVQPEQLNKAAKSSQGKGTNANVEDVVAPGDFYGMSQAQAAKTFLQRTRQAAYLEDIAKALHRGKATEALISGNALKNLSSIFSRSEDFISVARGRWGLAEFYPGRASRKSKKDNGEQQATSEFESETREETK